MIQILVKQQYQNDYITRAAGEKLRLAILKARQDNEKIEIDFSGLIIASTSFFDEAFAKLSEEEWNTQILADTVILLGLNKRDFEVMKQVCQYRGLNLPKSWTPAR